ESVVLAKQAVENQEESLHDTVESFQMIRGKTTEIGLQMNEIVAQMEKIQSVKTETLGNIENISAMAQQTQSAIEQLTENAQDQFQLVENLKAAAGEMDEEAVQMKGLIERFTV
ncbi:MAG: hypothetical protein PWP24_1397, partial [Clostridiales bacterium]|nr:hypothetical protein [Clostridiales bacterium]